jgi:hypothetical protein
VRPPGGELPSRPSGGASATPTEAATVKPGALIRYTLSRKPEPVFTPQGIDHGSPLVPGGKCPASESGMSSTGDQKTRKAGMGRNGEVNGPS